MASPEGGSWLNGLVQRYGLIGAGLWIGTSARYGLALGDGVKFTRTMFIADALLLGIVGLIALFTCEWLHAEGYLRALITALIAVSSDRIVRLSRDNFYRGFSKQIEPAVKIGGEEVGKGLSGQVPPTVNDEINRLADELDKIPWNKEPPVERDD